jgi:hypothetical protein
MQKQEHDFGWLTEEHLCPDCFGKEFAEVKIRKGLPRRPFSFAPGDCPSDIACTTCDLPLVLTWAGGKIIQVKRGLRIDELIEWFTPSQTGLS